MDDSFALEDSKSNRVSMKLTTRSSNDNAVLSLNSARVVASQNAVTAVFKNLESKSQKMKQPNRGLHFLWNLAVISTKNERLPNREQGMPHFQLQLRLRRSTRTVLVQFIPADLRPFALHILLTHDERATIAARSLVYPPGRAEPRARTASES